MTDETPSTDAAEADSKDARAEGVGRMLSGEEAPQEAEQPMGVETGEGQEAPAGVGESTTRRGEDMVEHDGKEAGRIDTGSDGTPADRPTGTSTARDASSVDPQDPVVESPLLDDQGDD